MKRRYIVIWFSVFCLSVFAQQTTSFREGLFRYSPFGHSFLSDMHPDYVRFDVQWHTNHPSYDWGQTGRAFRMTTAAVMGMKLPIWHGNLYSQDFALSVTMPISANIWLDLSEPVTAPVVDTDYRIAAFTICFLHRLPNRFVHNYSISWNPFKHESTHIGDELALQHTDMSFPLRRVNVSYNYTELTFTLNEAENRLTQNHSFRVGLMLLWQPRKGWYFVDKTDGDASEVHPILSPWEMYLQYQYQSPTSRHGFQGVGSIEVRNRVAYGYPDYAIEEGKLTSTPYAEKRVFTYNAFLGVRFNTPNYDGYFSRFALGVRLYHGICPWGQFRNITNYNQAGICLIME